VKRSFGSTRFARAVALSAVSTLVVAGVAFADNATVDGDFVADGTLAFGDLCPESGAVTLAANWYVVRSGGSAQNNYQDGSTVTFALRPPNAVDITTQPAGGDSALGFAFPGANTVALPGGDPPNNWNSLSNGTLSDPVPGNVSVTPGAVAGSYVGVVKIAASGNRQSDGASGLTNNADLSVSWTVLADDDPECAVAGFELDGFYQPVNNALVNGAKAGRVIPLKFNILDGDGFKQDDPSLVDVFVMRHACNGGAEVDLLDPAETLASGKTELRWDADGQQMIFNWKTPKAAGCYRILLEVEGDSIQVDFQLS
jgi:hypothetical protein